MDTRLNNGDWIEIELLDGEPVEILGITQDAFDKDKFYVLARNKVSSGSDVVIARFGDGLQETSLGNS